MDLDTANLEGNHRKQSEGKQDNEIEREEKVMKDMSLGQFPWWTTKAELLWESCE